MKTSMTRLVVVALVMTVMAATSFAAEVNFRYFPTGTCLPLSPQNLCALVDRAGVSIYLSYDKSLAPDGFTATLSYEMVSPSGDMLSANTATQSIPGSDNSGIIAILPYTNEDLPHVVIKSISVTMRLGQVSVTTLVREPVPGPTY